MRVARPDTDMYEHWRRAGGHPSWATGEGGRQRHPSVGRPPPVHPIACSARDRPRHISDSISRATTDIAGRHAGDAKSGGNRHASFNK